MLQTLVASSPFDSRFIREDRSVFQCMEWYSTHMEPGKTRRQIAAEATQRVIVEAATRLFLEHGYHATSIGAVAREAGVAVQTIYNSIGSKRDLLSGVLDFAAAGARAPIPVPTFMSEQAEREPDPRRVIDQLVEFWRGALARTAPVFRVIREAAALDPEVAELERRRAEQRLRNYASAARILDERGALRPGLSRDDAAAAIFAIGHPDIYRFFVLEETWEPERWAEWVRERLYAALLSDAA
jgi:AcrR family transcriptional regulator